MALEVEYRTSTAFLVAYSLNLSKGGLFLETDTPLPVGTSIRLRFQVQGGQNPIETEGAVIWVREKTNEDGPSGMGIAFLQLEARYGAFIDSIVSRFEGIVMVVAGQMPSTRNVVARYMRGMMSCHVHEVGPTEVNGLRGRMDLAVVDFAGAPEGAQQLMEGVKRVNADVPILALIPGNDAATKARASAAGASDYLPSPPPYNELYRCVLRAFSRLITVRTT
jgi:uncharacterized protein (TIGR02266 family)